MDRPNRTDNPQSKGPLVVTSTSRPLGHNPGYDSSAPRALISDCTYRYEIWTVDIVWAGAVRTHLYTLSTREGNLWYFRISHETAQQIGGSLLRFYESRVQFAVGTIFRVYGRQAPLERTLLYLPTATAPDTISLAPVQFDPAFDMRGTLSVAWQRLLMPDTNVIIDETRFAQTIPSRHPMDTSVPLSARCVLLYIEVHEEEGQWTLCWMNGNQRRDFSRGQRASLHNQRIFSAKLAELRECIQKKENGGRKWKIFPIEKFNM